MVLCLFKHGEKLEVCIGLLYRMEKEPVTIQKRFPTSATTLSQRQGLVVCNLAGHQGREGTLSRANQCFFNWPDLQWGIRMHVKCCQGSGRPR